MQITQPDPHLVWRIKGILEDVNYSLPYEAVEAVVAAMSGWMMTPEGLNHVATALKLQVTEGLSEVEYFFGGEPTQATHVKKVTGFIVDGVPAHPNEVELYQKELDECGICNSATVCVQEVQHEGKYKMACAYCIRHDPSLNMNYVYDTCETCNATRCAHNPKRSR